MAVLADPDLSQEHPGLRTAVSRSWSQLGHQRLMCAGISTPFDVVTVGKCRRDTKVSRFMGQINYTLSNVHPGGGATGHCRYFSIITVIVPRLWSWGARCSHTLRGVRHSRAFYTADPRREDATPPRLMLHAPHMHTCMCMCMCMCIMCMCMCMYLIRARPHVHKRELLPSRVSHAHIHEHAHAQYHPCNHTSLSSSGRRDAGGSSSYLKLHHPSTRACAVLV